MTNSVVRRLAWPCLVSLALLTACGDDEPIDEGPVETAAEGVTIQDIAIYQSLKRILVKDGKAVASKLPLIAERDALIRVFYKTAGSYNGEEVTARLTIKGHTPMEVKAKLGSASKDDKLESTLNFYPPTKQIIDPIEYSIELLQEREAVVDNAAARFPVTGYSKVGVEGEKSTLRVMLVPFRYKADGSDRLPDTSAAQLKRFKERFLQLYPVSDVKIILHAPIDWTGVIAGNGQGWQAVGMRLLQVRGDESIPDDTYLYGFFNPASTLQAYCGMACMLGVTLLNNNPPDKGIVGLRLALGVGFVDRAPSTAVHEIGHSHGRKHANCGPGLNPSSIDNEYPGDAAHQGGKIGVWGFDMITRELVSPDYTDIMGYCSNQWISDYNFTALWQRGKYVNLASWQLPPGGLWYDVIVLDRTDQARWARRPVQRRRPLHSGHAVEVILDGETTSRGEYYRFDHMPGGWLFVPRTGARSAEFRLGGRAHRVDR
jgi:hypothetical protein